MDLTWFHRFATLSCVSEETTSCENSGFAVTMAPSTFVATLTSSSPTKAFDYFGAFRAEEWVIQVTAHTRRAVSGERLGAQSSAVASIRVSLLVGRIEAGTTTAIDLRPPLRANNLSAAVATSCGYSSCLAQDPIPIGKGRPRPTCGIAGFAISS